MYVDGTLMIFVFVSWCASDVRTAIQLFVIHIEITETSEKVRSIDGLTRSIVGFYCIPECVGSGEKT